GLRSWVVIRDVFRGEVVILPVRDFAANVQDRVVDDLATRGGRIIDQERLDQALHNLFVEPALGDRVVRHGRVGYHLRIHLWTLVRDLEVVRLVELGEAEVHLRGGEHRLKGDDRRRVADDGLRGDLHLRGQDQREVFVVALVVTQIPIGHPFGGHVRLFERADLLHVRQGGCGRATERATAAATVQGEEGVEMRLQLALFRSERGKLLLQTLDFTLGQFEQCLASFYIGVDAASRCFQAAKHRIRSFYGILFGFDVAGAVPKYFRIKRDRAEWARRSPEVERLDSELFADRVVDTGARHVALQVERVGKKVHRANVWAGHLGIGILEALIHVDVLLVRFERSENALEALVERELGEVTPHHLGVVVNVRHAVRHVKDHQPLGRPDRRGDREPTQVECRRRGQPQRSGAQKQAPLRWGWPRLRHST